MDVGRQFMLQLKEKEKEQQFCEQQNLQIFVSCSSIPQFLWWQFLCCSLSLGGGSFPEFFLSAQQCIFTNLAI